MHPRWTSALALAAAAWACSRGEPALDAIAIALPFEVTDLDPHAQDKIGPHSVLGNVYEPLVAMDAGMRIVPCLAEVWESPDATTWVFRLRKGVTFHDGRPLRAADVVFSLDRVRTGEGLELRTNVLDVAEVRSLDASTVQVRTARPTRILLNKLASVAIVPEGSTAESLGTRPTGTGPYQFVSWTRGRSVRLRRNDRHWGKAPVLREAEFVLGQSHDEIARGVAAGRFQMGRAPSRLLEQALGRSGSHRVVRGDDLFVQYLGFDLVRGKTPFSTAPHNPFRDSRVRRAIHLAVDRKALVSALSGDEVPATQPVPRFVFGFDPGIQEPVADRERARALLREAGLAGGFEATLHARNLFTEAAQVAQAQLAEVGIRVQVKPLPASEFYAPLSRREFSFWLTSFSCPSGDASDFLDDVLHTMQRERHLGTKNYGGYSSPALDAQIEKSRALEAVDDRGKALQAILRSAMEQLVVIPLYTGQNAFAVDVRLEWRPRSDGYVRVAEIGLR